MRKPMLFVTILLLTLASLAGGKGAPDDPVTLLFKGAGNGKLNQVKDALSRGANVNIRADDGYQRTACKQCGHFSGTHFTPADNQTILPSNIKMNRIIPHACKTHLLLMT